MVGGDWWKIGEKACGGWYDGLVEVVHVVATVDNLTLFISSLVDCDMSCAHEHGEHGHDGHDHDVPLSAGPSDNLYPVIDTEHVVALNALGGADRGRVVIK